MTNNPSSTYFERVAGDWDNIRAGYFTETVREAAISKAYLRPEMVVADVGAGTGFVSAGLAPLVRKVHVLDGSPAMLDVARKNLGAFENIEYHLAESQSLPLPSGGLDAVFANMYLHHCPDPQRAIQEMARLLKPGGRLLLTDMDSHDNTWMKEEMSDVWMGFEREQIRAWFQGAGLVNIIVDCTGQSCCAKSEHPDKTTQQERTTQISVFVAAGTKRVSMRDEVQDRYAVAAETRSCCGGTAQEQKPAQSSCCGGSATSSCCSGSEDSKTTASSCCDGTTTSQSSSSCCSNAGVPVDENLKLDPGYTHQDLSQAPQEAGEISLGCGNPVAMAGLRPGEIVLDIGSGGGLDSFLAAQRVGAAGRVIGVDMTPAMLERARKSAEKGGFHNVEFRQGYAESLPVQEGSVDVVLSNCVINLTEDKGLAFREAYRALKVGGRLEISDIVTSGPLPLAARLDAATWAECVAGALPEQEYLDLVKQAGFGEVQARRSASQGGIEGVEVYSLAVSARKSAESCDCGSSGCCGD